MNKKPYFTRIYPIVFLLVIFALSVTTILRLPYRTLKLKTFRSDMNNLMNKKITCHSRWIDLFGLFQLILGKHELDDFKVIKDSLGMLHQQPIDRTEEELQAYADNLSEICCHSIEQGADFLYVQAPHDLIEEKTKFCAGFETPSNEHVDKFLALVSQRNIPMLDSRKLFSDWQAEEIFYKTDHHWRVEAAFHTAESVLKRVGKRMAPADEFRTLSFPNVFLGSLGVKAGKYFAGMDDFNVYIPTFDTQYQVYNDYSDGRKLTQSGDFSEVFLNRELLEASYLNKYNTLIYGADKKSVIVNLNQEKDGILLIVADSFGRAIVPYLSLAFSKTIYVDPQTGRYDEGILALIGEVKPDLVLVLFNGRSPYIQIR
jgi:hypothetical protein